jgi:Spy/CpxP family protein refolding chaperone
MKRRILVACLMGLMMTAGARAADEPTSKPPGEPKPMRPGGPLMESILPSRVLDGLGLTADQKAKYADLEAAFKKAAAKWRADNNYDPAKAWQEMQQARDAGDQATLKKLQDLRKGLADIRKTYVDQIRGFLTDDQKAKLDRLLARGFGRGGHGGPGPDAAPPAPPGAPVPPPPPPSDK